MKKIGLVLLSLVAATEMVWTAQAVGAEKIVCEGEYKRHLQGVCTDGTNLYWSHTDELVKTDGSGKRLVSSGPVASHHGDLCWKGGIVYVAVNLGAFNGEGKAQSWAYAYRDADLSFVKRWPLPEVVYGAGGMTEKGGRFYVIGGLPSSCNENYVYEYASDFTFVKRHVLASGWTNLGIQTIDFQQGRFIFGTYGQRQKEGEKKPPSTMAAPADLSSVRFIEDDSVGEGVVWFKDRAWRAEIDSRNAEGPNAERRFSGLITPARFNGAAAAAKRKADPVLDEMAARTEAQEWQASDGGVFRYRWHAPAKQERGRTYPLIILLHGAGERGTDNVAQLKWGAKPIFDFMDKRHEEFFFLAGQVPQGKRWVEVDWAQTAHDMPAEPSETMRRLIEFVERVFEKKPIDRSRVYVTGVSMGGYGTWDLLCRKPAWFAAAMPICGGADVKQAPKVAKVPIWIFHGDQDTTVPFVRSRRMTAALWACDGNVKYTEYPGVGHGSWIPAYGTPANLKWLVSQRKETK